LNTLEIRFPATSHHALLLTWLDLPDEDAPRVAGSKQDAANLNAFTIAEAERQWVHHPGVSVPRTSGQLLAISPDRARGYDSTIARASRRRNETDRRVNSLKADGGLRGGFEILTVNRNGGIEVVPVAPPAAQGEEAA